MVNIEFNVNLDVDSGPFPGKTPAREKTSSGSKCHELPFSKCEQNYLTGGLY